MREEPVLTGSEEGGARDVLWQLMAGRREERREGGRKTRIGCMYRDGAPLPESSYRFIDAGGKDRDDVLPSSQSQHTD